MNLGLPELLVILAIVLLVVGARRLPALGRALGQSVRAFREGVRGSVPPFSGEANRSSDEPR